MMYGLEWLGCSLAIFGFGLLAYNRMLYGFIFEAVGSFLLIVYGLLTKQYAIAAANVLYTAISLKGIASAYKST